MDFQEIEDLSFSFLSFFLSPFLFPSIIIHNTTLKQQKMFFFQYWEMRAFNWILSYIEKYATVWLAGTCTAIGFMELFISSIWRF